MKLLEAIKRLQTNRIQSMGLLLFGLQTVKVGQVHAIISKKLLTLWNTFITLKIWKMEL